MDPNLFANLGIAGVALYIIFVMLKYFMDTLNKKDTQITQLINDHNKTTEKFKKHIEICNTNFITLTKQANTISVQQTAVLEKLIAKIDELTLKPVTVNQTAGDVVVKK